MGRYSSIPWCDTSVNPTSGCDGCELWPRQGAGLRTCYAGRIHEETLAKTQPTSYGRNFADVRMLPGRMVAAAALPDLLGKARNGKPWLDGRSRHVFIGNLSDTLSRAVSFGFLADEIMAHIATGPGSLHTWMLLTKRVMRLGEFQEWYLRRHRDWPENLVCGTSVTTQRTTLRALGLAKLTGRKFLSVEPLLEPVDIRQALGVCCGCQGCDFAGDHPLIPDPCPFELVIVGGESGDQARPCHLDWIRQVRDASELAGAATFVKQLGSVPMADSVMHGGTTALVLRDPKGEDPDEWPPDLRVRRFPPEFPRFRPGTLPGF